MKPNFFPCCFYKMVSNTKCHVYFLNKIHTVDIKDLILAKSPCFTEEGQYLYFFQEKANKWLLCKLSSINKEAQYYEITWTYKGKTVREKVSFRTIKLRPLPFDKNLICKKSNIVYKTC